MFVPIGRVKKGVHLELKQKLPNPQVSKEGDVSKQVWLVFSTFWQTKLVELQNEPTAQSRVDEQVWPTFDFAAQTLPQHWLDQQSSFESHWSPGGWLNTWMSGARSSHFAV